MSRIVSRYVFIEWVPINHKIADTMGYTYERFTKDRVYLYLPLIAGMDRNEFLVRRKWNLSTWANYIDSHITDNLTIESLAKLAGYSPTNYRDVFMMYYNISPTVYILQRRLYLANKEFREEVDSNEKILKKYHFQSKEQFEQLYQQEFSREPYLRDGAIVTLDDLLGFYEDNKDKVRYAVRKIQPFRIISHTVKQAQENKIPDDLTALVIFWFREDFDDFAPLQNLFFGRGSNRKKVFLWNEDPEYQNGFMVYSYRIGLVTKKDEDPEAYELNAEMQIEEIPGGQYAIFTTLDKNDSEDPQTAYRLLTRCAFGGWINANRTRVDFQRRTFVLWTKKRLFFYVPVLD